MEEDLNSSKFLEIRLAEALYLITYCSVLNSHGNPLPKTEHFTRGWCDRPELVGVHHSAHLPTVVPGSTGKSASFLI
jgi:hypothetical protein